jgi:antibiotic biosynthesis monooxygenase (ABM) superfamily enzyme
MRTYENYLEDVGNAASKFEGFLGFDVVGPSRIDAQGNATYILMSRFQKRSQLLVWISSKERKDLYRKVLPYITVVSGDIDSSEKPFFSHGFDSLFLKETKSNPAEKADLPAPPPKYKTVILTYCILNVNAAFIRTVIAPFYPSFFPGPVSLLITLVLNVTITSYLSNPMLNKLFQDWIHSYTMKDIPKSTIGRILHLGIPGL